MDSVKVAVINIRSLTKRIHEARQFAADQHLGILGVSETLVADPLRRSLTLTGYHAIFSPYGAGKRGMALYFQQTLRADQHPLPDNLGVEAFALLVHGADGSSTLFISIYFSPSAPVGPQLAALATLLALHPRAVIMGDFNCRHLQWNCGRNSARGTALHNFAAQHPLAAIFYPNAPTHVPHRGLPGTLDFVVTNGLHFDVSVHPGFTSDHDAILIELLPPPPPGPPQFCQG